jgi:hypothetical protein
MTGMLAYWRINLHYLALFLQTSRCLQIKITDTPNEFRVAPRRQVSEANKDAT